MKSIKRGLNLRLLSALPILPPGLAVASSDNTNAMSGNGELYPEERPIIISATRLALPDPVIYNNNAFNQLAYQPNDFSVALKQKVAHSPGISLPQKSRIINAIKRVEKNTIAGENR